MLNKNIETYYARRAPYYDALYHKPERQPDLAAMRDYLKMELADRKVLEIACGTGYWTQPIAETAASVLATDLNEPMLAIARQKNFPRNNVVWEACDMYQLTARDHDALFGGFIWSHIPLQELEAWLDHLHRLLKPGSRVVFADNRFVESSNSPLTAPDDRGNVYQQRELPDSEPFLIVKNFPGQADFERVLKGRGSHVALKNMEYYWVLSYTKS